MAGFLTKYINGKEAGEKLEDNYIHETISRNNHAFLIGLHGNDVLSFNPRIRAKRGLSYRTAGTEMYNQEYAALFNCMLDHIMTLTGHERETCIAYISGFLCYFTLDQNATPYIRYRTSRLLPAKCRRSQMLEARREVETAIDCRMLESHCRMHPSQVNVDALLYLSRKDTSSINHMLKKAVSEVYHYSLSSNELAAGIRSLRRRLEFMYPSEGLGKSVVNTLKSNIPFVKSSSSNRFDFTADAQDFMNERKIQWYPYVGCAQIYELSFEEIFQRTQSGSLTLLGDLDGCLSWGISREELITSVLNTRPY
ncbi:MAG: hypothetical protein K5637_08195 [Lachnospiraceae bacterium]|nr:hypothetical protein [Lachnospiraceae bacterium]